MAIKLRTVDSWKYGQTNIIPHAGTVTFSEDGIIEVDSIEIAEAIENAGIGIYIVGGDKEKALNTPAEPQATKEEVVTPPGEPLKTKSEEDELNPPDPNKIGEGDEGKNNIGAEGTTSTIVDEKSELIKALNEKGIDELKELAKPFPKKEWKELDQAGLVNYLAGKL